MFCMCFKEMECWVIIIILARIGSVVIIKKKNFTLIIIIFHFVPDRHVEDCSSCVCILQSPIFNWMFHFFLYIYVIYGIGSKNYHNYSKLFLLVWHIQIHSSCFCILCSSCFFRKHVFYGIWNESFHIKVLLCLLFTSFLLGTLIQNTWLILFHFFYFQFCWCLHQPWLSYPELWCTKKGWSLCFQWRISQLWACGSCCHTLTKSGWTYQCNSLHKSLLIALFGVWL